MAQEWFDDPSWGADAQKDFRKRLSRARDKKLFYLGRKASAVMQHDPEAALGLCEERLALAVEDDDRYRAYTQMAGLLAAMGRHREMLQVMDQAITSDIMYYAVLAGEYCCLVGFLGRTDLYQRALQVLDVLDANAQRELGRPFRGFAARAARALIDYDCGRRSEAIQSAREALELALERSATITTLSGVNQTPEFPNLLHDKLLVIAGLWDERELGPPPEMVPTRGN